MDEDFLRCSGIVKQFGSVRAVDGVSLSLTRGHLLALLGPSGCGKTTLLRMIAGFETPDAGEIELDGRVLTSAEHFMAPERRRVAMVFQDFALFPHLSVGGNVAFGLSKGADKKRRISELLDLVGLDGLEGRMPHQLSGGQQQRVALARALASEPELILLDEPFSNLDPSVRAQVRGEVKELLERVGMTAVFVTHDQEEALSLAEQVGVMIAGRLLQLSSPAEIYTRPASRAVGEFVGNANFLPGTVRGGIVECELGSLKVDTAFDGPADVMVRAESLVLAEQGVPAVIETVEYYGHHEMISVRLQSGASINVRLLATPSLTPGQQVGLAVIGEVFAFPKHA